MVCPWDTVSTHVTSAKAALASMDLRRFCPDGTLVAFVPTAVRMNVHAGGPDAVATISLGRQSAAVDVESAWRYVRSFASPADIPRVKMEVGSFGFRMLHTDRWSDEIERRRNAIFASPPILRGRIRELTADEFFRKATAEAEFPHPPGRIWVPAGLAGAWQEFAQRAREKKLLESFILPQEKEAEKTRMEQAACEHVFKAESSGWTCDDGGYILTCEKCLYWIHTPRIGDPRLPPPCEDGHGTAVVHRYYGDSYHCSRCAHPLPAPAA